MTLPLHDLTAPVEFVEGAGTGAVSTRQARYVSLLPPCNHACPAGEDIQAWLAQAQAGHFEEAWRTLMEDNPLPAVCGRVCYHPCETACNRAALDSSVGIHAVERFLGDLASRQGWQMAVAPVTGQRILVVGAGPAGLSAAYHLRRAGHSVEIHEAASAPGGMLHFGIPAYRLPRADLLQEVARLEVMGVRIRLNLPVTDIHAAMQTGNFAAAFLAIGTHIARRIDIPKPQAARMLSALALLRDVETQGGDPAVRPRLGRRVVVYGAGNTAMDAARTARRLGAQETTIVFLSDRQHMEAHPFEADEAAAEGVRFQWLSSIRAIGADGLQVEHMALDAAGVPQPTGQFETLPEDALVLAIGQQADSAFLRKQAGIAVDADGSVLVDTDLMTGAAGIFAGGDLVPGPHSVTAAVGQGRQAARTIHAWLQGQRRPVVPPRAMVDFRMLHLPVYVEVAGIAEASQPAAGRLKDFSEIVQTLTAPAARHEAQRCLSCGNCFECDHCFAACPEDAIRKLGPGLGYQVNPQRCTGCAVCVEQCPCHALELATLDLAPNRSQVSS